MAYYNPNHANAHHNANHNNAWAAGPPPGHQGSWDPARQTPSINATTPKPSPAPGHEAQPAQPQSRNIAAGANDYGEPFYYQFKSIDRALETWKKSTKAGNDARGAMGPRFPAPVEFAPMQAPPFNGPPPPPSSFFPPIPPPPGSSPRYGGARSNEQDQSFQAKRRFAAQRERDLRNYHQDQQFNKHLSGAKSDRSMSPNAAMSESDRRDLIARQHKALYGEDSSLYNGDDSRVGPRAQDQGGNSSTDAPAALAANDAQHQPPSRAASNSGGRAVQVDNNSSNANSNNVANHSSSSVHQQQDEAKSSRPRENDTPDVAAAGRPQQQQQQQQPAPGSAASVSAGPRQSSPPVTSPSYVQGQGVELKTNAAMGSSDSNDKNNPNHTSNDGSNNTVTHNSGPAAANSNVSGDKTGGGSQEEPVPSNGRGAWSAGGAWAQPKVWR